MGIVSLAVPFSENWYFDSALRGVREAAEASGHEVEVRVEPPGPAARAHVAAWITERLDHPSCVGAIAMQFRLQGEQVRQVTRSGKPVVLVGGPSDELPVVRLDDEEIARRAVQHLIGLGHQDIAHLGGSVTAPDDFTIRADRVRGYSEAMRDAGLEMQATVRASAFALDDATRAATSLLSGPDRPTAVFAVADEVAFGVLAAARALGLSVPRDLSVIGIDDHAGAAEAGLTTLRQLPAETGRAAAARLLGWTDEDDQVLDVDLVVRTSTARPGGSGPGLGARSRLAQLFRRTTGRSASRA